MIATLGLLSMVFVAWFTWAQANAADSGRGQSRRASIIEAWVNLVIGFTINFVANLWIIPLMTGHEVPLAANFWGGWVYTSISIVRQFVIRRWFNERIHLFAARAVRSH